MKEFIEGSGRVRFVAEGREAVYGFIERVLKAQQYRRLSKGQKGIVRRFLAKITGLSRAQVTRLIAGWSRTRRVQAKPPYRRRFPRRYTAEDIGLLAAVDAAHEDLSGPAVGRILEREYEIFGKAEYEVLSPPDLPLLQPLTTGPGRRTGIHRLLCWIRRAGRRSRSRASSGKQNPPVGRTGSLAAGRSVPAPAL